MQITIKHNDERFSVINVQYHPSHIIKNHDTKTSYVCEAGLWTTVEELKKHFEKVNKECSKIGMDYLKRDLSDIKEIIREIKCSEAPLEIYHDCEDHQPWKHTGLRLRNIPYSPKAIQTNI